VYKRQIEAFVLREGTDYGEIEYTLKEKVEQVKAQLLRGEAFIEYSEEHETVTIVAVGAKGSGSTGPSL